MNIKVSKNAKALIKQAGSEIVRDFVSEIKRLKKSLESAKSELAEVKEDFKFLRHDNTQISLENNRLKADIKIYREHFGREFIKLENELLGR